MICLDTVKYLFPWCIYVTTILKGLTVVTMLYTQSVCFLISLLCLAFKFLLNLRPQSNWNFSWWMYNKLGTSVDLDVVQTICYASQSFKDVTMCPEYQQFGCWYHLIIGLDSAPHKSLSLIYWRCPGQSLWKPQGMVSFVLAVHGNLTTCVELLATEDN